MAEITQVAKKYIVKRRRKELALSSSFHRSVYSEIEEVGWEHLVGLGEDLTFITFRIVDKKGKTHVMAIHLPQSYPICAPSISAHLEKFQEFWSTLDDIDKALWVVHPRQPSRATSCRQINLGNDCYIVVSVNASNPSSLPECRFLGPNPTVDSIRKTWRRNSKRWMKDKPFPENLASILETSLPRSPDAPKNDQQEECGICYAHCLPIDDELGAKSGSGPDYTCDNSSCNRAFHSVCLGDWLRSITTTRQSFDVLFGNCPYCLGPVAVKVSVHE